jgi:hypothetical protein
MMIGMLWGKSKENIARFKKPKSFEGYAEVALLVFLAILPIF